MRSTPRSIAVIGSAVVLSLCVSVSFGQTRRLVKDEPQVPAGRVAAAAHRRTVILQQAPTEARRCRSRSRR